MRREHKRTGLRATAGTGGIATIVNLQQITDTPLGRFLSAVMTSNRSVVPALVSTLPEVDVRLSLNDKDCDILTAVQALEAVLCVSRDEDARTIAELQQQVSSQREELEAARERIRSPARAGEIARLRASVLQLALDLRRLTVQSAEHDAQARADVVQQVTRAVAESAASRVAAHSACLRNVAGRVDEITNVLVDIARDHDLSAAELDAASAAMDVAQDLAPESSSAQEAAAVAHAVQEEPAPASEQPPANGEFARMAAYVLGLAQAPEPEPVLITEMPAP